MHSCHLIVRLCGSRAPEDRQLPCHLAGLLLVANQEDRMPRRVACPCHLFVNGSLEAAASVSFGLVCDGEG